MKKIIILLFVVLCINSNAQTKNNADKLIKYNVYTDASGNSDTTFYEKISYITPSQDTLYLLNNELGLKICEIWNIHKYTHKKPAILIVDKLPVDVYIKPQDIKVKKL